METLFKKNMVDIAQIMKGAHLHFCIPIKTLNNNIYVVACGTTIAMYFDIEPI
jgi:hypothetical protein